MMNAFHLIWIIPLSAMIGYFAAVMCWMAGESDRNKEGENM